MINQFEYCQTNLFLDRIVTFMTDKIQVLHKIERRIILRSNNKKFKIEYIYHLNFLMKPSI